MPSAKIDVPFGTSQFIVNYPGLKKAIRVRGFWLSADVNTTCWFYDEDEQGSSSDIYGVIRVPAHDSVFCPVCPPNGEPWFILPQNTGLFIYSNAVNLNGLVVYDIVG